LTKPEGEWSHRGVNMRRFLKRHAFDGLLLLPLFTYLFVLTGLPLLSCLMLSFTEGEVGLFPTLANYRLV
jgi:ABC-type sugar transport system permease subunit